LKLPSAPNAVLPHDTHRGGWLAARALPTVKFGGLLRRSTTFRAGLVLIGVLFLLALVGPVIARHDPYTSDFVHGITAEHLPASPSKDYWLGADRLFRDVFARLATGARLSLLIGIVATTIATVIGTVVGIIAGWYEGRALDSALMRIVDVGLAFPFLLIVMALGAALERTTALTICVTLGCTGWLGVARIMRAKTLQVRGRDFVTAAIALGQSTSQILLRHILPNVVGPLVVIATILVAQMILAESVLSFLGAGISPPTPTWGHMLFEGKDYLGAAPWICGAPAVAISIAVLGFNLLGEGLRDALDPLA
jgi:ABC-type dipeptide/oligopeptide/nickel transport system permease subunit